MIKLLFALSILLTSTGCQALMQDWQRDRLVNHLEKIRNYHGTIVESGILDGKEELVSEVWFQAPGRYSVIVRSPEKHAGTQMSYDGKELRLFYPQTKFAIVYKNLSSLTAEDRTKLVHDLFNANLESYDYQLGGNYKIAGYPAVQVDFKAKTNRSLVSKGGSRVFDDYSFPLWTSLDYRNGRTYSYVFRDIKFNTEKFDLPRLEVPTDAIVSDWDLASKGVSEAEARKDAGFGFRLPKSLPMNLKLEKIIRQKGPVPAFTAQYGARPYSLSVITFKDYGVSLVPGGRGLKVTIGKSEGRLIPNPHMSSLSFASEGAQYVLVGNVPEEALIAVANEIATAK